MRHRTRGSSPVHAAFTETMRPRLTGPPRDAPRLLVVTGAQGTRKTTLARWVALNLGLKRPIVLDGDDIVAATPSYQAYFRRHGGPVPPELFQEEFLTLRKLSMDDVRSRRLDLVMVGGFTDPDFLANDVGPFRRAGYRADLAASTAQPAFALAHMVARDAEHVLSGAQRTLSGQERQQRLAGEVVDLLHTLETGDNDFTGLHLFTLQGRVAHSQERLPDGQWDRQRPGGIARYAEELRSSPWTLKTANEHGRLMERGRAALAVIPESDTETCRTLLRAAGEDAKERRVDSYATGLLAARDVVVRATRPVPPTAANSRPTDRTTRGRGQRARPEPTSPALPLTFQRSPTRPLGVTQERSTGRY